MKGRREYLVTFDVPGYNPQEIAISGSAPFTNKLAKSTILKALKSEEFGDSTWKANPDHPRLNMGISPPTEMEKAKILKMPELHEGKPFLDSAQNSKAGISLTMPGLDPAMRLKAIYTGAGTYDVYIESVSLATELGDYEAGSGTRKWFDPKKLEAGLEVSSVPGTTPMDAAQRALARVLDDKIWDNLIDSPEPDTPDLDKKGVPGNQPEPVPSQISLIPDDYLNQSFDIADMDGNVIPGYKVTVNPDPFETGDETDKTMEVTISFPDHPEFEALNEFVVAEDSSVAALTAIKNLQEFEWGKGGLGSGVKSPEPLSGPEIESMLLEDRPQPIKSTTRSFGNLTLDELAMEASNIKAYKLFKVKDVRLYKFAKPHAPSVQIRRMGLEGRPQWDVVLQHPRFASAHYVSYAKTYEAAIEEAVKMTEEPGYKWQPYVKPGIFTDLYNLQNAIDRYQFETNPGIERRVKGLFTSLQQGKSISFRGYKITSLKELAVMGQVLRHPSMESYRIFYLDRNFQILGHEFVSTGALMTTEILTDGHITQQMDKLGARYFIDMHNHPGGLTTFSPADKAMANSIQKIFGDKYLGHVLIDSGEYSEMLNILSPLRLSVYPEHSTKFTSSLRLHTKERIPLTAQDLGWDPGTETPSDFADFSRAETAIRPNDPLYQYDIKNEETGKLIDMHRAATSRGKNRSWDKEIIAKNIAKLGKYLQTEKNWTTLFFTGYSHDVIAAMEYKDLHRLSAEELWDFIRNESRRFGGQYVSAYVGKGDWYSSQS